MPSSFLRVKLPDARRPETKHSCPSCCSGPGCCLPFLMPSKPDTKLRFSVIQQPIFPVTASHLAKDFMISQNVAQKLRFLRCAHAVNNMLTVIFPAPKIHRVAKRIEVFENVLLRIVVGILFIADILYIICARHGKAAPNRFMMISSGISQLRLEKVSDTQSLS